MNEHSVVRIESPAFAAGSVHLIEVAGKETISQLFEFHAQVVSTDPAGLDVEALIGAPAVLVFERGDVEVRRMGGLIAGIRDSMHEETGRMVYDLWFAPRAFRMGLVETYEIFMDVSVPDIVKKKLERAGLVENTDFELRLAGSYPPREFVVQYKETDLAFVSRLLEHLGISFFFEHKDGADIFVLSDQNSGFAPVTGSKEVPFRSRGERLGVFALESQTRMTPARYVVKDYNYRTPQVALQASAPAERGDGGYVLEYGAHFKSPDEGAQIAKIRAEEIAAGRTVLEGKSDRHGFSAGAMFLLEEHPRGDMELLLTEVSHRAANSVLGTGKEGARDYESSFKAIPYKTPFRPPRVTPKPRIHGVITGVIDAAAKGPYAELDSDGRYRVRFLFDGGSAGDGQASRLCRMAQPHGGGGYGMHFPLRSGVEVILTFVEGDPDRPIILGVVPNPQTPSPVTAGNGTRNVIRTGGGNEINIDDTAGGERIKLTTPFGKSLLQIGYRNHHEDGIAAQTEQHMSTKATKSINWFSRVSNLAGDAFKVLSAKDITQYCTPFLNLAAITDAVVGGAGNAADIMKAGFTAAQQDRIQAYKEVAEDKEKEARKLKDQAAHERERVKEQTDPIETVKAEWQAKVAAKKEERAAKNAELAAKKRALADKKRQLGEKNASLSGAQGAEKKALAADIEVLKGEIAALEAQIVQLEGELAQIEAEIAAEEATIAELDSQLAEATAAATKLEEEAAKLEEEAETAQQMADKAQDDYEETTTGKIDKAIEDYVATPGEALMSTVGDAAGFFAQLAADVHAASLIGLAEAVAITGRLKTGVPPVEGSPKFIGGGVANGALLGGVSTFVGGGSFATLFSGASTAVLATGNVTVKGRRAEVSGLADVQITANEKIDLKSTLGVSLEAEGASFLAKAGMDVRITAKQAVALKATETVDVQGADMKVVIDKATNVTSKEGNIDIAAKTGDITVKARGEKCKLVLKDADVTLERDGWGLRVRDKRIGLGPLAEVLPPLSIDTKMVRIARDKSRLTLGETPLGVGATLAQGGCAVQVEDGGVTVVGKKLHLL